MSIAGPWTDISQISNAGPSRQPPSTPSSGNVASKSAPGVQTSPSKRSPGRSFSLSLKSKGKLPLRTGLHDRRWELDFGKGSGRSAATTMATRITTTQEEVERGPSTGTSTTTADSSLRRTVSSEDTRSLASSCTSPPPHPPPKDPIPRRPPDVTSLAWADPPTLLQNVRMKMSTDDQEAMRKLRLTMDISESVTGTGTGSSGRGSPLSPHFGDSLSSHSHGPGRPPMGSRRSTLSRQMISEDLDDEPTSSVTAGHNLPQASADFVIAVIGHKGVGKSTVIRRATRAWGVSSPVTTTTDEGYTLSSCFSQIQPGGKIKQAWKVEFLEMDIELLQLDEDESLWPALVSEIHGTILCYNAQDRESLKGLDVAIRRLSSDGKPVVLFGCKSDPDSKPVVDPSEADKFGQPYNVGLIEVTHLTSDGKSKMRNGLRWLLYKLEQRQRREQRRLLALDIEAERQRFASSHLEEVMSPDSDASSGGHRLMYRRSLGLTNAEGEEAESDKRSSSSSLQWMMKSPLRPTHVDQTTPPVVKPRLDVKVDTTQNSEPPLYLSLRALLDKLFGAIISLQDEVFVRSFFMTYRRFCKPAVVMQEFVDRFQEVQRPGVSKDVQMWAQQKMTGAIIDWVQAYPGDLCDEETTRLFKVILDMITERTFMAHLTVELINIAKQIPSFTDPDKSWSLKPTESISMSNRRRSIMMPDELVLDDDLLYELDTDLSMSRSEVNTPVKDLSASMSSLQVAEEASVIINRVTSASESKLAMISSSSDKDAKFIYSGSTGSDGSPAQWTAAVSWIMNNEPEHFASELTRLQRDLFMAIRPRDVFRHDLGKESDTPVGRSITFFNRVSRWVSTMILASPKAKHRARTYERFTLIAHQLRRLHNYDSLYAVISGMQETSVHRLSQTHALVQLGPGIEKDWQSHLKLMDPRGGYVHYRRALQADLSHGRAAIPLMTTVLGLISRLQAVRKEDIRESDGHIQWDKFARFQEILAIIPECQRKVPMVQGSATPAFLRMIEETSIISDEDALFARSRMLEPTPSQRGRLRDGYGAGMMLRKLGNLGL